MRPSLILMASQCYQISFHNVQIAKCSSTMKIFEIFQTFQIFSSHLCQYVDPAAYQAYHHIRNCCLFCVSCDRHQCDVAGHTDQQANARERSRDVIRAQRVVYGESTPGRYHHHQHQEASSKHYHVMYLTMSNTNTLTITCLCYPARGL